MKRIVYLIGAIGAAASPLHAEEGGVIELDEIIISGGLTPAPAPAFGRAVTVVTGEEIERRNLLYAVDALRGIPGVAVNQTGGAGGVAVVRIRGAESKHTQVFIDGVKASSPDNLAYDFSGLLAADIERIEVLRGPQSALFGANALGGVISIITKRARTPGFSTEGSVEAGSNASWGGDAAVRYRGERLGLSLAVARQSTDGFDISATPGGGDDGSDNLTLNLSGDLTLSEAVRVGGTLRYIDRSSEYDQFNYGAATRADLVTDADLEAKRREIYGSVFGEADLFDGRVETRLNLGIVDLDDDQFTNGAKTTATTAGRRTGRLQATVALDAPTVRAADHTLTGAFDYERETYRSTDPALVFDPTQLDRQTREQLSGALEYRGEFFDAFDLQLGLRHDRNDKFKDFTTWSVSGSWRLPNESTRLHGSLGTGAQNPSLIEQFGFFPGSFVGNPALKPEESFGWDIGVEQSFMDGRGLIDVTYFQDRVKNEITSVFDPTTFLSTSVNAPGKSRRRGIEIEASYRPVDALSLGLTYTWLDAEDSSGAVELRRPKHDLGLEASYLFADDRARLTLNLNHVAGLRDGDFTAPIVAGSQVKLDDYTLVGVSGSYRITDQVELTGRVSNIFNTDYEELDGYATEGRAAFIGLRARW
ncbi:TonB-dependent receptor plug domain-containing protein [Pikeienuella sp. HZG-20]|uniref:TonB-dependent receptor plug domain-containing protein n=1 Tax=Paludibacillus litoralis TaxID=3133267 RepID=UPI0030EDF320